MRIEIVPGPASIGIANGVSATSCLLNTSSFTSFLIPLCLLNDPVNNAKPDDAITRPPAIFKEFMLIPKKERIYLPEKKETNRMISIFSDVRNAMRMISCWVLPSVRPAKIGTVANGLITEINAARLFKYMFIFFAKVILSRLIMIKFILSFCYV